MCLIGSVFSVSAEAEAVADTDEADLLAWLDDIQPEETTTLQQESRSAEFTGLGESIAETEAAVPAEEASLD